MNISSQLVVNNPSTVTIMNKIDNNDDDVIEGGDIGGSGSGEKSNAEVDNNKNS